MSKSSMNAPSNIENISTFFSLPISFNDKCVDLDKHIIKDLELIAINCLDSTKTKTTESVSSDEPAESSQATSQSCVYNHMFKPSNCFGEKIMKMLPNKYTTDKTFLKDTQTLLKTYKLTNFASDASESAYAPDDYKNLMVAYDEITNDKDFKEKYYFLDWQQILFLNKNESFMQLMSMYNLASPVLSLFLPVIMLIIPFIVIKFKGIELNMDEYVNILTQIISNHAIGKVFTQFNEVDMQQKIYLLISAAFYIFSIYQNILVCTRFYENMRKIYNYLNLLSKYLNYSMQQMRSFVANYSHLKTYELFIQNMQTKMAQLELVQSSLIKITCLDKFVVSVSSVKQIGTVMTAFYEIYDNEENHSAFMYSFGFHGYIDNILGLQSNISQNHVNYCEFDDAIGAETSTAKDNDSLKDKYAIKDLNTTNNKDNDKINQRKKKRKQTKHAKNTSFNDAYYPILIGSNPIKNSYNLNKHLIITGPNASGKTTVLKTTLINLIISQQFGCGCYSSAFVKPYNHLHCYLNIPDTMGRDSLLQAEARRCKEIIDSISNNDPRDTHFCVFDELYSGTNPEEAIISARVVMEYLAKNLNVSTILTTHYVKLCKQLNKNKHIRNCHMKVVKSEETLETNETNEKNNNNNETNLKFEYSYLLEPGMSTIKGGVKVLIDMNYPREIIDNAKRKHSFNKTK